MNSTNQNQFKKIENIFYNDNSKKYVHMYYMKKCVFILYAVSVSV